MHVRRNGVKRAETIQTWYLLSALQLLCLPTRRNVEVNDFSILSHAPSILLLESELGNALLLASAALVSPQEDQSSTMKAMFHYP